MNIIFEGENDNVERAVAIANSILKNPAFYNGIRAHSRFDYSTATPSQIADFIEQSALDFYVKLYKGKRRSRVLGYVTPSYPNVLFLNNKKLNRPIESITATIIHESVHAIDKAVQDHSFGHKGNRTEGNQNTAPYWIGKFAKELSGGTTLMVAASNADELIYESEIEEDILDPTVLKA